MADNKRTPAIRFRGFEEDWKERKLGEISNSFEYGLNAAAKKFDGRNKYLRITDIDDTTHEYLDIDISSPDISLENADNYLLQEGDIVFARTGASVGKTYIYRPFDGLLYYAGFLIRARIKPQYCAEFIFQNTLTRKYEKFIRITSQRSGQPGVNAQEYAEYSLFTPKNDEQKKIGEYFHKLDKLISLHQKKHTQLIAIKKAMLDKLFPKNGETVPEIRFAGFTGPWEKRKFSEVVQIERGGSPRPIDDYITESSEGLNWVKIGDAPELGHYITKTAEKIRPEGLQKTREVHPGDLVLSNSMSFGRPYIMSIDGCIHDGWLLIRDSHNKFDLIFLCHLLGTPQMIKQYKSLAAGSTVNNLNKELVGNTTVMIPEKTEQRTIGQYFESLDTLITLQQRKINQLQHIKKAFLDKMFV